MSKKTAADYARDALYGHSAFSGGTLQAVEAELAAAEERGRRSGVEERDELRDRMHQTIAFLLSCVASGEQLSNEEEAGIRAMLREALALRVPHASEDPPCAGCGHAKWRHQYGSKAHAFCSEPIGHDYCQCKNYLTPRDSGKEG